MIKSLRAGIVVLAMALLPLHAAAKDKAPRLAASRDASSAPAITPARALKKTHSEVAASHHQAYFGREKASRDARHIADWIVDSADNLGLPFVIVDKTAAKIFVFDSDGRIQGAAPVLLGLARGDHTVPGVGDREYADIPPKDRTTPAGRFVAALGMNLSGKDIVWVDYDSAVSIHRVITTNPRDRRLERLATPTALDNRISYGCINVPARFYESVVKPAFAASEGIVYVLPDTRPVGEVFGSYDVLERRRQAR